VRVESPEGLHVVEHLRHTYGELRQAAEASAISPVH
jgi:hypothetical protein